MTHKNPHSDEHWELLFGVRRSVRYHMRRQKFLDTTYTAFALLTALAGSVAVMVLVSEVSTLWAIALTAATAVCGALEMVLRPAMKARLHNDLSREFVALEQDLVRAGDEIEEQQLRELTAKRLGIEAKEPTALRVLDSICHEELSKALGIEERLNINWFQRLLANIVDIAPHRIRALPAG